jgi:hypothetical protein
VKWGGVGDCDGGCWATFLNNEDQLNTKSRQKFICPSTLFADAGCLKSEDRKGPTVSETEMQRMMDSWVI